MTYQIFPSTDVHDVTATATFVLKTQIFHNFSPQTDLVNEFAVFFFQQHFLL